MSHRPIRPASARALPRSAVRGACFALLLATAAACGGQSGDGGDPGTASDTSSSEATPSQSPTTSEGDSAGTSETSTGAGGSFVVGETVRPGQAVIVSASNVTGETTTRARAITDEASLDGFVAGMDGRLARDVRAAVRDAKVPSDSTLFGAVVSVGCDTPTAVEWSTTGEGIDVTATLPKSEVQCLVPVTSVALFLVPD
ncbi:hypothetical protein [Nocardioides sp.]|uniref:hypothetical protein n=1 Tax=Nocardioides sp. TaxID=35761 RepID=UPI00286DCB7E|nr:hypothetical protein [Nocardioides sp.]